MHRRILLTIAAGITAFTLGVTGPARAACPSSQIGYSPTVNIAVGTSPAGCVSADFDGDGILDVAVAVSGLHDGVYVNNVAILHGSGSNGVGNGNFSLPTLYPAGITPFGLVAGDFTGDGIRDLVVSNVGSTTLTLLKGLGTGGVGDGTFAAGVAFAAGGKPHHIAAADFNHDGILDLAVAINDASAMTVLIGHGDGTFAPPVSYAAASNTTGLSVADVNEDGILDILVAQYDAGSVGIFRGNGSGGFGDGTFQPVLAFATIGAYDVLAADVTGDGHADLVVGKDNSSPVPGLYIFPGDGHAGFGAATQLLSGACDPGVVADFDGDGVVDIAAAQSAGSTATLLRGMGGGAFQVMMQRPVASFPVFMSSGDYNADGIGDMALAGFGSSFVSVLTSFCAPSEIGYRLVGVRDVPHDQGGRVWLTWNAHPLDVPGGTITGYRIWRQVPAAAAMTARAGGALRLVATAAGAGYWEAIATQPAQLLSGYAYTAGTPQDSLEGSNPRTSFMVTALTSLPTVFYDTPPESGYSVDNLAPFAPSSVQGQFVANHVVLNWVRNGEADLYGYRVHRGASRFFVPGPDNLVGAPTGEGFVDPDGGAGEFYKLAAVDVHGNVGPFVLVEPSIATSVEVGLISLEATPTGVTLTWYADEHTVPVATLERSVAGGAWEPIASGSPDGGGQLVFHDDAVSIGTTYAYRLAWITSQGTRTSQASTVTIPGLALVLGGAWPNPAHGAHVAIRFALKDASPAQLALFDVSGRRVVEREVGALGAGPHLVDLSAAHLAPGLYLARLTQQGEARRARVVLAP